jgi:ABC-type glycerol-3-phosphate transport system substrate-binding protein
VLVMLLSLTTGCQTGSAPEPEPRPESGAAELPLRLLVVDDPDLAEVIQREWQARSELPVEVRQVDAASVPISGPLRADLVFYPSGMLGQLAEARQIVPFPADAMSGPQLARGDIFPAQFQAEARWGSQVMALPLGSPQFCLLYRKDRVALPERSPPEDWAEYLEFAKTLASSPPIGSSGAGAPPVPESGGEPDQAVGGWYGVAEPLAVGWAGQVLLARAASYARHRSQYSTLFNFNTMEPLIAGPPFVKALDELVEAYGLAPPESLDWIPEDVRQAFFAGRLGMAMTWPTHGRASGEPLPELPVGFLELPGARQVYGVSEQQWETRREDEPSNVPLLAISGRLGSITRETRRAAIAADALAWISGRDWSPVICPASRSTTLFRDSHLERPEVWVEPAALGSAGEYAELVQRVQTRSDVLLSLRIPGRARYLAALDEGVRRAVKGQAASAEALAEVAERWRTLTDELGRDAQRDAYSRSLGLQP